MKQYKEDHETFDSFGESASEYLKSNGKLKRDDLLFPELSYQIVGIAFEVFNELGPGHLEKYYQKAMEIALRNKKIPFKSQIKYDLVFLGEFVGRGILDFLVDDKIVVEIKKDLVFTKTNIEQVLRYLKLSEKELAILINFSSKGVIFKRIINLPASDAQSTQ